MAQGLTVPLDWTGNGPPQSFPKAFSRGKDRPSTPLPLCHVEGSPVWKNGEAICRDTAQ